jgi:hypothetical protein
MSIFASEIQLPHLRLPECRTRYPFSQVQDSCSRPSHSSRRHLNDRLTTPCSEPRWPGTMTVIEIKPHRWGWEGFEASASSLCSRRNKMQSTTLRTAQAFAQVKFGSGSV